MKNVVTHIEDRLEESDTLQQQAQNNSLAQFSASPDLQNEFVSAVIGAMESSEDLSTQILNNGIFGGTRFDIPCVQACVCKVVGDTLRGVQRGTLSTPGSEKRENSVCKRPGHPPLST